MKTHNRKLTHSVAITARQDLQQRPSRRDDALPQHPLAITLYPELTTQDRRNPIPSVTQLAEAQTAFTQTDAKKGHGGGIDQMWHERGLQGRGHSASDLAEGEKAECRRNPSPGDCTCSHVELSRCLVSPCSPFLHILLLFPILITFVYIYILGEC